MQSKTPKFKNVIVRNAKSIALTFKQLSLLNYKIEGDFV